MINFCISAKIDYKYFENGFDRGKYKIRLFINKIQLHDFFNTHMDAESIRNTYDISYQQMHNLKKKYNLKQITLNKLTYFYSLRDVEKHFISPYDENLYYHLSEAMEVLGLEVTQKARMDAIKKSENLKTFNFDGKTYYYKDEIHNLITKMKEIKNTYCTGNTAKQICNLKCVPREQLTVFSVDPLARLVLNEKALTTMFSLQEVYELKQRLELKNEIREALHNNPKENFGKIIELKNITFSENSPYTEKEWYSYCRSKIFTSNQNKATTKSFISSLISCTEHLANMTKDRELYSFTSNEINLNFFNHTMPIHQQYLVYTFIIEFHSRLNETLSINSINKKTFNVAKIINPYLYEQTKRPKETYEYDEYI